MSYQVHSCSFVEVCEDLQVYDQPLYELTEIAAGETPFGSLVAYLGPPQTEGSNPSSSSSS